MVEYRGPAIEALSMEERMTICNMSIEAGARAGMIAPDEKTFEYIKGRRYAPKGREYEEAVAEWRKLRTDDGAVFDKSITLDASEMAPQVSWGTNPGMVTDITGTVPDPDAMDDENNRKATRERARIHGAKSQDPDTGHTGRQGFHRLMHELEDTGPDGGGEDSEGAEKSRLR